MNKENKVTSLELSKKIHDKAIEKGFELPESEYYWSLISRGNFYLLVEHKKLSASNNNYQALDCAELGDILPDSISQAKTDKCFMIKFPDKTCLCLEAAKTEAEVRGKMFYYLLDNDLL